MRLQRLEIAGFKSFPDRSELTFDDGVTAIVGPNGCGKSNVVDALTWVLGEQSAKSLRGDRMEDVIFGGSDARKATGAAEVRLRLGNVPARTPAREPVAVGPVVAGENGHGVAATALLEDDLPLIVRDVEVSRRLYRSGESEYLIDGEICRLKDVQDLLMDAGLGVKAYAVIEQGKIGQILSARPTDRRQLIEEAAGVTKYKSRRRSAELKLEAAQQNLTRVDDIIYEVEKQRGALKRQAAKARRYRRLREELRRWEKVQFSQRYRQLGGAIEAARTKLSEARERETAAAAGLAEAEARLEALRLELTEADGAATASREAAHATELEIGRLQQQVAFDRQQVEQLTAAAAEIEAEVQSLEVRREPARLELEARRAEAAEAAAARERAGEVHTSEQIAYTEIQQNIEGLEGDVEAARSEVFAAVNASTALRHAMEHAAGTKDRIAEQLGKLDVEAGDLRVEAERAASDQRSAEDQREAARAAVERALDGRRRRDEELTIARSERQARLAELNGAERDLAALQARLASLEELDAARAEYGDGARLLLADAVDLGFSHLGSVADRLDVDRQHERAVEACLGELLQHVVVSSYDDAAAGLRLASERQAGRVGFVIADGDAAWPEPAVPPAPGLRPIEDVVRISGEAAAAVRLAIGTVWIADDFATARLAAAATGDPIVTLAGEVFHGHRTVHGGERAEARGILATKRQIKELRERGEVSRQLVERLHAENAALDARVAETEAQLAALQAELHAQEKAAVGFDLQAQTARQAAERVSRKRDQIASERRAAEEELRSQDARHDEARASIARIQVEQDAADAQLNQAQRRLFEARERLQEQSVRTAEARASHAALVERATGLAADVRRLEDASAELDARVARRRDERERTSARAAELSAGIVSAERELDARVQAFDVLRDQVRAADERSAALRSQFNERESTIRESRRHLENIRGEVARHDVARATAESDLGHLATACVEAVQATLDEVAAEVAELEAAGALASPRPVDDVPDDSESGEAEAGDRGAEDSPAATAGATGGEAAAAPLTADDMVADLRAKIERMGAVNMMAIDQFDDLESRHAFLTTQRKDLVDSIAATGEAIRKIDKTTKERFREAFAAININFEKTFTTLFGGGRAGLVLLDESDQLESGIDMIAQPPGKRLQSVQLLSGGEKALTAMALMFAIFQYRPSPFCLLDEIDAPLDDANIGRFVDMLQGMQDHTQFVLITHNRKTMEIADRLYGVTMEEPGVSKLISVQLN
jgi:chromosome segregation protein